MSAIISVVNHSFASSFTKGIKKKESELSPMTPHVATTITLSKGVSMESVSKILGHMKITTTQIYARILNSKVKEEMKLVESALENAN